MALENNNPSLSQHSPDILEPISDGEGIESVENIENGEEPSPRHAEFISASPEEILNQVQDDGGEMAQEDEDINKPAETAVPVLSNPPTNLLIQSDIFNNLNDLKEKVTNGTTSPHDTVDEISELKRSLGRSGEMM